MDDNKCDVLIIGAGLTGLTLAYLLQRKSINGIILEARERVGGRILTKYSNDLAPQDMGATWLGKKHSMLTSLLDSLDLGIFEQVLGDQAIYEPISTSPPQVVKLPPNSDPSYRIVDGSSTLINKLVQCLPSDQMKLGQVVKRIVKIDSGMKVYTEDKDYSADIVVSTIPPYLLDSSVVIEPSLPDHLREVMQSTHTWMGESIKIGLTYKQPFWREQGSSGTIMSNVGPIPEMYDHANHNDDAYALIGFLNGSYHGVSRAQRLEMILNQLTKYYGDRAQDYLSYEEVVWAGEPYTYTPYEDYIYPHQNNGHPSYRQVYLDGRFYIAGTETASDFPGYMDGAVRSATFVNDSIMSSSIELS